MLQFRTTSIATSGMSSCVSETNIWRFFYFFILFFLKSASSSTWRWPLHARKRPKNTTGMREPRFSHTLIHPPTLSSREQPPARSADISARRRSSVICGRLVETCQIVATLPTLALREWGRGLVLLSQKQRTSLASTSQDTDFKLTRSSRRGSRFASHESAAFTFTSRFWNWAPVKLLQANHRINLPVELV